MKPKTMILMVVAIVCGLGASYMTSRLLAERGEVAPVEQPKVTVLVARKTLDMGTFVKVPQDMFVEKLFTKGDEPKNAVVSADLLKLRYLRRSLRANDHVTPEDLAENGNTINWQLPEGFRAIGMRVDIQSIAGGWASLPGSRVDIVSVVRRGNDDDSFAGVLLENVLVLSADGANRTRDDSQAMVCSVVTLALKAGDGLRLTMASQIGTLTLMLRKQGDKSFTDEERVTFNQLIHRQRGGNKTEDGDKDDWEKSEDAKPVNPKMEIPPIKADEQPKDLVKAEPPVRTHVMTILEGEHQRKVVFRLGDNDEVLSADVPEAPAKVTPPAPPATQPTPPAPTAQPTPPPPPAPPAAPTGRGKGPRSDG